MRQHGNRDMSRRVRVLVTGVGGRSVGHQVLHALSLVREKYRLVATDVENFSFGLYLADAAYLVPSADAPDYIPAIQELVTREQIQVILPGTEPEVRSLVSVREAFEARGCIVLASSPDVVHLCSNKIRLYDWLRANGFVVPSTAPAAEWRRLVAEAGFPLVGKPTEESGGSRNVAILTDEADVERYLDDNQGSREVLLQEYVESPDEEYTVGVLTSKAGGLIDSIVIHRRLLGLSLGAHRRWDGHNYALSTGYSQGCIVKHAVLQEVCEQLALKIGIRGPSNIQCRISPRGVTILEVHPRFSGTTSIRAEVGFNEPDTLIRNYLFSESFGRLDYQTEVAAIRAFQTLIVPFSVMNNIARILSPDK
jgi:carbamoyl-phosphate synthase large subunit